MAAPQLYTKMDIQISNGSGNVVVLQDTDVKMTRNSGLKSLKALGANDWVGAKQGAKWMTAEFNSQVPLNGFEFDAGPSEAGTAANGIFVNILFIAASSTLASTGIITMDDMSDSVEGETKLAIHFEGQWAPWHGL